MISCTEFIPAYSELFKFMDQRSGRQAVYDYWAKFFSPTEFPLGKHVEKKGLRGCWDYWTVIFEEEACDNTMLFHEKEGWLTFCMHSCPSKGRFNKLGYLEPFDEYCKHCDGYDEIVATYGLSRTNDYRGTEHASCRSIIVDPEVFTGDVHAMLETMYQCEKEGCKYTVNPEACPLHRPGLEAQNCLSADLQYLHPQFHVSMDIHLHDLLELYGEKAVHEYLAQYVAAFHKPLIEQLRQGTLPPLADYLRNIYAAENASDALTLTESDQELLVTVSYSPAIRYMQRIGHTPKETYQATTSIVYEELAKQSGIGFELISYDLSTGAAQFRFYSAKC